ncbi:hypothetical protein PoB_004527700 [Plakobranchus ocellatus]|uniref:Uncharacterized protein n=1 Tax=Plakobranchus ocellatus TaxID=259542 RepID=A0AAV4BHB3_9GAST|nr:hypothetical protein PoB_004527700 [Plakobranchus ocellatus]
MCKRSRKRRMCKRSRKRRGERGRRRRRRRRRQKRRYRKRKSGVREHEKDKVKEQKKRAKEERKKRDDKVTVEEIKKTFANLDLATDKTRQDRRREKMTTCLSRIRTRTLVGTHRLARQRNQANKPLNHPLPQ